MVTFSKTTQAHYINLQLWGHAIAALQQGYSRSDGVYTVIFGRKGWLQEIPEA